MMNSAGFFIKLYLAALAAFFALDMLWLGLVARSFYRKQLGFLLSPAPNWGAAIVFYLLFIAGLLVFVVLPGLSSGSLPRTLVLGAFFGLVTYATYDLTNQATLKDWPWLVTLVDIAWGILLATLVSLAAWTAGNWLLKH
jgi:uncharacterized membrane protein